jgi:hypothetical protein
MILSELPLLFVFPAKAGIQGLHGRSGCPLDPRFRGGDENPL